MNSYLTVYFFGSVKFALAPPTGVALGLSEIEIILCTVAGMSTTAFVIPLLGEKFLAYLRKKRLAKGKPIKIFTPRKRLMVRIWQRFSIWGIAFLTPVLFSPIVGTAIAVSFGVPRIKILLAMALSAFFWALVMTLGSEWVAGSWK
ncbi:MAG: hypothetical protein RMJ97_06485 [Raineya sp.]|nr:hypothetical protein [Raineya sp.]